MCKQIEWYTYYCLSSVEFPYLVSFLGICLMDRDPIWRFHWEFTFSGEVDKQACISTSNGEYL